ncbi:MAG: ATP-binding cassette domain-containing protein, partial [Defluviitaleaceae bacterium]|nr:ATP-binding cassette domain-containing protein [Defluviitaleaceae bacterium]
MADHSKIVIELKNLDKSFNGVHAVNSFNMEIYEGELLGLIGPNGCGKSTSVNLMTGVYTQDSGEIIYYDRGGVKHLLKDQAPYSRAKMGVGRTFQTPKPFSDMTV